MPRILKDLTINEVSSVDVGAGRGVKVLLMKRDAPADKTGESQMTDAEIAALVAKSVKDAVDTSTAAINAANGVELAKRDHEIKVLKMSPAHKAFYDGLKDDDAKKAFADMKDEDKDAECAKMAKRQDPVEQAQVIDLQKRLDAQAAENAELKKRLDAVDLEKAQASFKKQAADLGATEDGDGELMRKAYSGDTEAQTAWNARLVAVNKALKAQAESGELFKNFGSSQPGASGDTYAQLTAKAEEYRKSHPDLSKEQAFAKVYEDPANAPLVQLHKRETAAALN